MRLAGRQGIGIQDLAPDLADALDVGEVRGALIANVEPDSPGAAAGLQVGDVVTAVDEQEVYSATDLRNRSGLTPAGNKVTLTVVRADGEHEIAVTIAAGDDATVAAFMGTAFEGASLGRRRTGSALRALFPTVRPNAPGCGRGDVIVAINRSPVVSIEDLRRNLDGARSTLAVEIVRNGSPLLLVLR